mgnify:FL=1
MINPMMMMQMLRGGNPQQAIMNAMRNQAGQNPVLNNALDMAEKQDAKGLEQLARNLCESNGVNADDMVKQIKSRFGIK